jgi:hypothetical protein
MILNTVYRDIIIYSNFYNVLGQFSKFEICV